MHRIITAIAAFMIALVGFAAPVAATESKEPDCKTVTTSLVDRPDSGHEGTWALDDLTRTVEICEHPHRKHGYSLYKAALTDSGTFTTLDVDHTPAGTAHDLPADVVGDVAGTADYAIVAGSGWIGFDPSHLDGQEIVSDDGPSTSQWVRSMFGEHAKEKTEVFGHSWSWIYTTCAETWVNQAKAVGPESGDITGLLCANPTDPTTTDQTCDEPGTITLTDDEGVLWVIDGESVEPGTSQAAPGELTVAAAAAEGYVFDPDVFAADPVWPVEIKPSVEACPGPQGPAGDDGEDGKTVVFEDEIEQTSSTAGQLPKTGAFTSATALGLAGLALLLVGGALIARGRHASNRR